MGELVIEYQFKNYDMTFLDIIMIHFKDEKKCGYKVRAPLSMDFLGDNVRFLPCWKERGEERE